jgi:hypothetical protein
MPVVVQASVRVVGAVLWLCGWASVARANDDIDEGKRLFDRAQFAEAVAAFDRAASGDDLSRDDLIELLEARALAHHASGHPDRAESDLAALLSLDPSFALTDLAPPALRRAFSRLSGEIAEPIAVSAEASSRDGRARVTTRVHGDVASLAREIRVHSRAEGARRWRSDEGASVELEGEGRIEWWVEVVGPGAAPIGTEGSEEEPRAIAVAAPLLVANEDEDEDASPWPWILLGGGLALAAGAAVVLYFVLSPSGPFQVGAPHPE